MASILRSGSFLRIFSGFKHSLASSYSRYEVTRIQKLQIPSLNLSIVRSFAAQRPLENVSTGQAPAPSLDKVLYRIDGEIRRTGRISKKDIDDIFGELKFLKYASSTQSLLLIRCCGSLVPEELPEVRNKLVQEIWDTLIKFDIALDISHYNALLKVYLENEHKFSPTEFLSTLEQSGIEPNRVTYQRLISRYCHEGDIDGASKILEFMKEKGLPVNENVFNALIMGHARADDLESAHGVIGVMQGAGLEPSQETYMMLMVGYAEKGDIDGLDSVLQECKTAEIHLHNREYMEVILALAAKGYSQHTPQFIEKLEKIYGYQQDAMNLIYRLLNAGCDNVAYQMFETMSVPQNSEGDVAPVGTFFIKQLIKAEMYSVATILQYCQRMKSDGLNLYALERALQIALTLGRPELSIAISRVMLEDGAPVRSHYFWPIIVHYGNQGEKEMLYNTIREMMSMDVPLTLETCRDYIFPALIEKDEEPMIAALKDIGMGVPAIINGCIAYYLSVNNLLAATQLLSRYRVKVTNVMRRDLADAYIKTREATAAATILRQMINESHKKDDDADGEVDNTEEGQERDPGTGRNTQDVAGMFIVDVMMLSRMSGAVPLLEPVLQAIKSCGISISSDSATSVKRRLGEQLTDDLNDLLDSLSSGDLTLQPLVRNVKPISHMDVSELEHRITEMEIKNVPHTYMISQLFTSHIRMRNIEKVEELKQKLESLEYPLSAGQYALLIELYASEGKLEKALSVYEELKTREPDVKLNASKVLRLATAMIMEEQLEECIKLLEDNASTNQEDEDDSITNFASSRFLNSALEKYDEPVLQRLFDVLVNLNYGKPHTSLCGPLIRTHLKKDNIDDAMEAFEKICKQHRFTPMKHELTLRFIQLEDTEKLQKLMDLSIDIHGEMNSLYDLVFAFIECGKVRQAKKILETPGLRARHQRLEQRCKRLLEEKRFTELEHLVTITKDVFDVDRNMMFMYLFQAYKHQQDCDKAIGIWTTMQEENIEPRESFLWELGQFLTEHGRDIPFAMPKGPSRNVSPPLPVVNVPVKKVASPSLQMEPMHTSKSTFNRALKEKDFDSAFEAKKQIENSGGRLSLTEESKLIEVLVQESKTEDAAKLAREMVVTGQYPLPRIFKYLLNQMAKKGDVEGITFFEKYLDETLRKSLSFTNRLCNAYMESGRTEEFLDNVLSLVESKDINQESVKGQFPTGGILGILERQNELLPKVSSIAEKYADNGIYAPVNCIWMHLFSEGSHAEANEIYNKYLVNSNDNLMFGYICQKARDSNNAELLPPLLEFLEAKTNTSPNAKGIAYSCWLDVLCSHQRYDEALSVLEGSLKTISLENYNNTALIRVKEGLALSNKTFPYTIPKKMRHDQQQSSSSSSSSSSDSDVKSDVKPK